MNADGSDEHRVDQGKSPIGPGGQISEGADLPGPPTARRWPSPGPTGAVTAPRRGADRGGRHRDHEPRRVQGEAAHPEKLPTKAEDGTVTWSPDGRQIAFTRLNKTDKPLDATAVFVADADGTNAKRVTHGRAGQEPSWSPDGTLISFRSEPTDEEFIGEIYAVKPDGSRLTQLTKAKGKQVFSMSFSTDSKWIVFAMEGVGHLPDLYAMRRDG